MATKTRSDGVTTRTATGGGLSFEFYELPPSLNRTMRAHWGKRKAVRDYYTLLFRNGYNNARVKIAEPVEVSVTWRVMKEMDLDNARGRFKLIGDAMKAAGIISDDNPEVVKGLNVKQEVVKHRAEQGFVVQIREYLPFAEV